MLIATERYETYNQPVAPVPVGPHLEFHGFSQETVDGSIALTARFDNINDTAAVGYYLLGSVIITKTGNNSNNDVSTSSIPSFLSHDSNAVEYNAD
jgi:hypothetical protein